MTTSTALRADTDTFIDPLGRGRAMGLPLLGLIADVMNQIPGMNRPAETKVDVLRPAGAMAIQTTLRTGEGAGLDPHGRP